MIQKIIVPVKNTYIDRSDRSYQQEPFELFHEEYHK